MKDISLCMSVYNQEFLIEKVLAGMYNNMTDNIKEFILLFDGCSDRTEELAMNFLSSKKLQPKISYADDVHEVKANNLCFKQCSCEYILTVQDDIIITEKNFDQRMLKPFTATENLLGVTGRDAVDCMIRNNDLDFCNMAGTDAIPKTPRNIFGMRQIINRGPILFNHEKLKDMNYLDERYAPVNQDDTSLFLSGLRKGYRSGAYIIDYVSKPEWGSTRRLGKENTLWERVAPIHRKMIIAEHYDLITMENKNSIDMIID